MANVTYAEVSWPRMSNAIEKVRQRLLRAVRALAEARVPYAAAGGNAVAARVSRVDESAVHNTPDVDIETIDVGRVDRDRPDRVPAILRTRLKELLDNPDG